MYKITTNNITNVDKKEKYVTTIASILFNDVAGQ